MYNEIQDETLFSHLAAEYRHLWQRICRLRKFLDIHAESFTSSDLVEELEHDLIDLRSQLSKHFEREEEGGLLDDAAASRPTIGQQIDALFKEHKPLLRDLDQLLIYSRGKPIDKQHWELVREEARSLLDRISDHQKRSDLLIQQGFNVDCRELID